MNADADKLEKTSSISSTDEEGIDTDLEFVRHKTIDLSKRLYVLEQKVTQLELVQRPLEHRVSALEAAMRRTQERMKGGRQQPKSRKKKTRRHRKRKGKTRKKKNKRR